MINAQQPHTLNLLMRPLTTAFTYIHVPQAAMALGSDLGGCQILGSQRTGSDRWTPCLAYMLGRSVPSKGAQ